MDALAALRLQVEWGADEALDEAPVDRIQVRRAPSTPPPSPLPQGEGEHRTPAGRAVQVAAGARSIEELRAAIGSFDGCALRDTASHTVFAAGDPSAGLLLIGDAPGPEEDRSGAPFAGAAGA